MHFCAILVAITVNYFAVNCIGLRCRTQAQARAPLADANRNEDPAVTPLDKQGVAIDCRVEERSELLDAGYGLLVDEVH